MDSRPYLVNYLVNIRERYYKTDIFYLSFENKHLKCFLLSYMSIEAKNGYETHELEKYI